MQRAKSDSADFCDASSPRKPQWPSQVYSRLCILSVQPLSHYALASTDHSVGIYHFLDAFAVWEVWATTNILPGYYRVEMNLCADG